MRNERVRTLVEIALAIAVGAVLNFPMFRITLPFNIAGGTVALNMLPIVIIALRRGPAAGLLAGAAYGFVDLLFDPFVVHPAQLVLDYPLAYGLVGLSGLARPLLRNALVSGRSMLAGFAIVAGVVAGGCGRFLSHVTSGIIFFAEYAPDDQPVWLYSILYNAGYMVPSAILVCMAALVVVPVLHRAVPSSE